MPAKSKKKAAKKPAEVTPARFVADLQQIRGVTERDFALMSSPLAWLAPVTAHLSTGMLGLDRLLGGGWPQGRLIEVAAWESVGKSTILDQSIAQAQRQGAVCALIDSEHARDPEYTERLGVDLKKLIVVRADTIEQGWLAVDQLMALQEAYQKKAGKTGKAPPLFVCWDSIAGCPTQAELMGDVSDQHVASAAKRNKLALRRLTQRAAAANATFLFTNQFYQPIGQMTQALKTYGGTGFRYFTSVRLYLTRLRALRIKDQDVGHVVRVKLQKTRIGKPKAPTELGLLYGAGVHNAYTLFEWGKTAGHSASHRWVVQRGAWAYLHPVDAEPLPFQGAYLGFADVLDAHPEVYRQMAAQYLSEDDAETQKEEPAIAGA